MTSPTQSWCADLQHVQENVYRCPSCGQFYEVKKIPTPGWFLDKDATKLDKNPVKPQPPRSARRRAGGVRRPGAT
ncbi:hypothetical protein [Streptomyces griseorubiginosus]|uniref:hypothetical protein n=1 Tax=Streptomyces griseorubiginosus TaxID=67304 RepID=UPI003318D3D1